jgi:hypothetical protein
MSGRDGTGLLLDTLAMAVPLEILALREAGEDARLDLARRLRAPRGDGESALFGADMMLYGGKGGREALANYARAIALLSYQPGGVSFAGLCWCAAHPRARWGEYESCPGCLTDEAAAKGQAS